MKVLEILKSYEMLTKYKLKNRIYTFSNQVRNCNPLTWVAKKFRR